MDRTDAKEAEGAEEGRIRGIGMAEAGRVGSRSLVKNYRKREGGTGLKDVRGAAKKLEN